MARIVYDAKRVSFGRSTGPSATIVVAHDKSDAVANYLLSINGELAKAWDLKQDNYAVVYYDDEKRRIELERAEEGAAGAVCFRSRSRYANASGDVASLIALKALGEGATAEEKVVAKALVEKAIDDGIIVLPEYDAIYLSAKGFMRAFGLSKTITKSCKLAPSIEGKVFCLALPAVEKK